ncbi:GNAT family N-acetyltransferase [Tenacibaculum larymnensis]|uniref:GNAT family N-acetyltransferase n=1 Tax=Tenacibaculum larymnensis TaxID=2878201 RepID=A0A9X4ESZ5_9FLAO|nr:GNAT family N-acetyltransferase [Tenacibaculum larymnensis]MDE1206002.1 GNAT family N-acetyltransferase [Tenacibaculum larymnensis]
MNDKISLERLNSTHESFIRLVKELDEYLSGINGDQDAFFKGFNTIDKLQYVVVCYINKVAAGCGAFKRINDTTVEVKRMYVKPIYRGKNIATLILKELEEWAREERFSSVVLETSKTMQPAVYLYKKNEYGVISNYGPYKGVESSICFKKTLN